MAQINYAWNPFQERADCRVPGEVIKTSANANRVEFVPRAAPFFAHDFKLYRQGSLQELKIGIDYVFAHPFDRFIRGDATTEALNKNVFGSVVLIKPFEGTLLADYDTIGGPFILDEAAFVELVTNIVNAPRQADWDTVTGIPVAFPVLPHPHPAAQTYDYLQMLEYLKNMIIAMTDTGGNQLTIAQMLEDHIKQSLPEAHPANKAAIALDLVPNMPKAVIEDLTGNSSNATVTIEVLKEAFRRYEAGTLFNE